MNHNLNLLTFHPRPHETRIGQHSHPATPGGGLVLLTGSPLTPAYADIEALRVLAFPMDPERIPDLDRVVERKLRAILSEHPYFPAQFVSEVGPYLCRIVPLCACATGPFEPEGAGPRMIAVLLERLDSAEQAIDTRQLFQLTDREQETVRFLVLGFTNKEIANRMKVSPHTIKAFLRSIMMKTAGQILGISGFALCESGQAHQRRLERAGSNSQPGYSEIRRVPRQWRIQAPDRPGSAAGRDGRSIGNPGLLHQRHFADGSSTRFRVREPHRVGTRQRRGEKEL